MRGGARGILDAGGNALLSASWLTGAKPQAVKGPPVIVKTLSLLLPALIPSWRFFKTVEPSPRIEISLAQEGGWSDWAERRPRPAHVGFWAMLRRMFWNPAWNADLYLVSCAERMTAGYCAHSDAQIIAGVREALTGQGARLFRYRLVFVLREEARMVMFIEYESPVLPLREGAA